jgi:hypothetical protein
MQVIMRVNMRSGNVSSLDLPIRNFSTGRFEGVAKIYGETMRQRNEERGGPAGTACMPGCPIACKHTYLDPKCQYITSSLEYETIALLGSNCGIDDLVELGKQTLFIEHQLHLAAGRQVVERLPGFFEIEPLSPHKTVYDVKTASVITEIGNKLGLQIYNKRRHEK